MSEPFFFSPPDDKRFLEAKDFLENRSETLDEIRTKFEDHRPVLASIMKKKLRTKAKKMEKTTKTQRKMMKMMTKQRSELVSSSQLADGRAGSHNRNAILALYGAYLI